jgi:LPPG:FO 2-phospho-L-lactate transferase
MTIVALCGGVGGAKLALGLYRVLAPDTLTVIVNTGDDMTHLGLRICPDVDTVLYTLAGLEHPGQGWGRSDETWTLMRILESLGEETWFKLGDGDTALHIVRTRKLNEGAALSTVIREFEARLGISAHILPMTDSSVQTRLSTDEGDLGFQEYFVKRRCQPRVLSVRFEGAADSAPAPGVIEALAADSLEAIVACPSNPYLSVDPILAVPSLRTALERRRVPLIVVSPLIAGKAVKGPTAKIMGELGISVTPRSIFAHYRGLADALVVDSCDADAASQIPIPIFHTSTLMQSLEDRLRLGRFVLDCVGRVKKTDCARAARHDRRTAAEIAPGPHQGRETPND